MPTRAAAGLALTAVSALILIVAADGPSVARGDDCFVSAEPSESGPTAPTDLFSDYADFPPLYADLTWHDNSREETCFVLEYRYLYPQYQVLDVLPANSTSARVDIAGTGGDVEYRVYAANESSRSGYSNSFVVHFPAIEPTVQPSATYPPPVRGDLECDGAVDGADAEAILSVSAQVRYDFNAACPSWIGGASPRGDLNCDGSIDVRDALRPIAYAAGIGFPLPSGCPAIGS